jgi:hypothetical protein
MSTRMFTDEIMSFSFLLSMPGKDNKIQKRREEKRIFIIREKITYSFFYREKNIIDNKQHVQHIQK